MWLYPVKYDNSAERSHHALALHKVGSNAGYKHRDLGQAA